MSPLVAAHLLRVQMKADESRLAGIYPNRNPGTACMQPPISDRHFCIGDFFLVDPACQVTFDTDMTLKEDYDFTASHLHRFGIPPSFPLSFLGVTPGAARLFFLLSPASG